VDVHARILPTSVAIVGGGAAGLAAARTLKRSGIETLVLEARSRVGGRAYTLQTPDGAFPIELGAEFIHGNAPAMRALLRESGAPTMETGGSDRIWEAAQRVLDRVDIHAPDRSVDEFLRSVGDMDGVEAARMLIEGFDAAIAADTSIVSIAQEWQSDANSAQSRPVVGYQMLIRHLAHAAAGDVLLDARVDEIRWSRGKVQLFAKRYGEALEIQARAAIITVPAGVLGDVHFTPPLPPEKHQALQAIAMGPVVKVMLYFREPFWDEGFHQPPPGYGFPTVWSRMPQPAPVLAAWAGGDAVRRLYAKHSDPIRAAVDTCRALFPHVDVPAQLRAAYWHDWQADPFTRGAYSYLRVKGGNARDVLAQPLGDTLFFAGEATSRDYAGTVSGALETGENAAAAAAIAPAL
jgi:monoamine oxidase